jgi:hypothetical protein
MDEVLKEALATPLPTVPPPAAEAGIPKQDIGTIRH